MPKPTTMVEMLSAISDAEDRSKGRVHRLRKHPSQTGVGVEFIGSKGQWNEFSRILETQYELFVFTSRWVEYGTGWLYDVFIGLEAFDVDWLDLLG